MTPARASDGRSRSIRTMKFLVGACFVAAVAAFATAAAAADLRGRVEGTNKFSANSFPLNGARVELMDSLGQRVVANAYTGPDGLYYFKRIGAGKYMIRVNGGSYPVTVGAGDYQDIPPIRIKS